MLQLKNLLQKSKPVKVNHLFPLVVGLPHALGVAIITDSLFCEASLRKSRSACCKTSRKV
jgi:hypothetical protein